MSKKKAKKKKGAKWPGAGHVVWLGGTPACFPSSVLVSRSSGDWVVFRNRGTSTITVEFDANSWPFKPPKRPIPVAGKDQSGRLTVDPSARKGSHGYTPKKKGKKKRKTGGPPDPPDVGVGD